MLEVLYFGVTETASLNDVQEIPNTQLSYSLYT